MNEGTLIRKGHRSVLTRRTRPAAVPGHTMPSVLPASRCMHVPDGRLPASSAAVRRPGRERMYGALSSLHTRPVHAAPALRMRPKPHFRQP